MEVEHADIEHDLTIMGYLEEYEEELQTFRVTYQCCISSGDGIEITHCSVRSTIWL